VNVTLRSLVSAIWVEVRYEPLYRLPPFLFWPWDTSTVMLGLQHEQSGGKDATSTVAAVTCHIRDAEGERGADGMHD
jgi:hypothetical protein